MEVININNQNEDSVVSDFNSGSEEELNEVDEEKQKNSKINLENIIYNPLLFNLDYTYKYFFNEFYSKSLI